MANLDILARRRVIGSYFFFYLLWLLLLLLFFFFRLHGSYEALKYGTLLDGLADLTGGITESINIRQDSTTCGRMLNKLLDMTSLVTCTVQPATTTPQVNISFEIFSRYVSLPENLMSQMTLTLEIIFVVSWG